MKAARQDLYVDKGSEFTREFSFVNLDGVPFPIEGYTYRFVAKESPDTAVEIFNEVMTVAEAGGIRIWKVSICADETIQNVLSGFYKIYQEPEDNLCNRLEIVGGILEFREVVR